MCRNIKTLYNFEPSTTEEEIQAAAIQFVRKISGFNKPSTRNETIMNPKNWTGRRDSKSW